MTSAIGCPLFATKVSCSPAHFVDFFHVIGTKLEVEQPRLVLEGPGLNLGSHRIRQKLGPAWACLQKLGRAFFQARTMLEGLNLTVFVENINWKSKATFGASLDLSSKQARWAIWQARVLPGLTLKTRARLRLEKIGLFPPLHQTQRKGLFKINNGPLKFRMNKK